MKSIETSFEVKKIFDAEVRDKKKTGRGIYKKTGSRGYVGRMLTTMDYLKGKAKREYMKSGDVKMSNVYKQLLPFQDLVTYTPENQKNILEQWRAVHSQKEIVNALGVNKNIYYKKLYDLEILERPKKRVQKDVQGNVKKMAKKGDILSYKEFRSLPQADQYHLLDYYFGIYDTGSLASIWNRKKTSIHQFRYTLKKYMTDNNLDIDDKDRRKEVIYYWEHKLEARKPYENQSNVKVEYVEAEEKKVIPKVKSEVKAKKEEAEKEKPIIDNLMNLYGEDKDKKQAENSHKTSKQDDYEVPNNMSDELDKIKKELAEMVETRDEKIRELIKESHLKEEKYKIDKENAYKEGQLAEQERQKKDEFDALSYGFSRVKNAVESEKVEEIQPSGMSFNYVEQSEGFIIHSDIKRFISMLEKNPDNFKVEMKITRIGEDD